MGARLDHIGIAVRSLDEAVAVYATLLSVAPSDIRTEDNSEQKVRIAFVELPNCKIELLEPLAPDSPIAKFLESRGEGIHHLCFVAPQGMATECERLEAAAFRVISRDTDRFFFLHPKDCKGSLIEFYGDYHARASHA